MATDKLGFDFESIPILQSREALEKAVEEFERTVQDNLSPTLRKRLKRKAKKCGIKFSPAKGTSL